MKIIISSHLDDAMLSLGGSILAWRAKKEKVKIIDIFVKSRWLRSGLQDFETTNIRKKEEIKACKVVDVKPIFLDFAEKVFRGYSWEKLEQKQIDWNVDRKTMAEIENELSKYLKKDQEIYFPLAIGNHIDHQLVNKIGEKLFKNKKFRIYFYEDLPYATKYPFKRHFVEKLKLKPEFIDITKFVDKKVEVLKIYKSQFYFNQHIAPTKKYAYTFKLGKACERVWN